MTAPGEGFGEGRRAVGGDDNAAQGRAMAPRHRPSRQSHSPADTGRPSPPVTDLAAARGWAPVRIETPAGWWRLFPMTDPTGLGRQFAATLSTTPTASQPEAVVWTTQAPNLWQLEETLGWAVPSAVRRILTTEPPRPSLRNRQAVSGWLPDEAIQTAIYRPWRASQVRHSTTGAVSYGRLLHDEHPLREWRSGDLRAEVLLDEPDTDPDVATYRYRIYQHDRVMFAGLYRPPGDGVGVRDNVEVRAEIETALRVALRSPAARVRGDAGLTDRQVDFLDDHGAQLDAAVSPEQPYPPGTRVCLLWIDEEGPTGTVRAATVSRGGELTYLWRPDIADLPGHPWHAHPDWALRAPWHQITDTLTPPGGRAVLPDAGWLATGAVVRTIDDPRFEVGTVLRAFTRSRGAWSYEIQPHDAPLRPLVLPAHQLVPVRTTAWRTVHDLLHARHRAGLPLRPGERLVTWEWTATVLDTSPAPRVDPPDRPILPYDYRDDATLGDQPVEIATNRIRPLRPVRFRQGHTAHVVGDTVHVHDPAQGHLAVDTATYHQALHLGADRLAEILNRRAWLSPAERPLEVAAALAVIHARDDVAPTLDGPPRTWWVLRSPGHPTTCRPRHLTHPAATRPGTSDFRSRPAVSHPPTAATGSGPRSPATRAAAHQPDHPAGAQGAGRADITDGARSDIATVTANVTAKDIAHGIPAGQRTRAGIADVIACVFHANPPTARVQAVDTWP
ncbi:hypothetical protein [Pseudofrankia sp. BMG5.37]|uniref:hypothetical protein n=1 Tax=Pseudofrankia sp. BMG5.37 TaxID=3050035 RepID=UPI0028946179|nr:hypothetical protein [Pseudofrankia sp. BMG5.37]MDT3444449.1 hypothetical protein [Pseudofrankia sp. BMG5.37]